MSAARVRAAIVAALMLVALLSAHYWRPTRHLTAMRPEMKLETAFPRVIGEWVVDDRMPVQIVAPDTKALIDRIYDQTLSRTYINPKGDRIMLSVAYGGDQSDATRAHRPEVCYPAQGFEILSSRDDSFALDGHPFRLRGLVARQGGRVEPISYWIMVGEQLTLSGTEQKMAQLSYTTRGVIPDGMLVRVSSIDQNTGYAFAEHRRFVSALAGSLQAQSRAQIIGRPGG